MNIAVIFGGRSDEHEVSRSSAVNVIKGLDSDRYEITKIGITKEGRWYLTEASTDEIASGAWENRPDNKQACIPADPTVHGILVFDEEDRATAKRIDCIIPVLHGDNGEDGTVQGLFELAEIPYVGPGVKASANGMDKSFTKIIVGETLRMLKSMRYPSATCVILPFMFRFVSQFFLAFSQFYALVFKFSALTFISAPSRSDLDIPNPFSFLKNAFPFPYPIPSSAPTCSRSTEACCPPTSSSSLRSSIVMLSCLALLVMPWTLVNASLMASGAAFSTPISSSLIASDFGKYACNAFGNLAVNFRLISSPE